MKLKNKILKITCDGGATGKSTGAKMIARKYNVFFFSSGLFTDIRATYCLNINQKTKLFF